MHTGRGEVFLVITITGELICFLLLNAPGSSAEQLVLRSFRFSPPSWEEAFFFFGEKPKLAFVSAVIGAVTVISLGRQLPSTNDNPLDGSHRVGGHT